MAADLALGEMALPVTSAPSERQRRRDLVGVRLYRIDHTSEVLLPLPFQSHARTSTVFWNYLESCSLKRMNERPIVHLREASSLLLDLESSDRRLGHA